MPLIGTISGSNGTMTTAVTGSLVIANRSNSQFPALPSDASLYISGVIGGLGTSGVTVVGGDLRVSGSSYLTDLQLTGHGAMVVQPYGTSAGQTGEVRFLELAANGGNYVALKAPDSINPTLSLTLPSVDGFSNYVLKTNGVGALAFAEVSTLLPSSLTVTNLTASNIQTSGDIAINGGDITSTAVTFNFAQTSTTINVGGITSTGSFPGDMSVAGRSTLSTVSEKLLTSNGGTGTVSFDTSAQNIFYAKAPTGNITANFTNVPTTTGRILTPTVILSQSSTAYIVSALQIDTVSQTINWSNGLTPTGNANKHDVFGFSLIRSGSSWVVLGQMSTYG